MIERDGDIKELNFRLAKMLFQTGAWISSIDQAGGHKSDGQELDAIHKTLQKFSYEQDYRHLKPIFDMTLSHIMAWPEWSRDLSTLPQQLKEIEPDISLELRQCFYDLAYSVAIRYRERNLLSGLVKGLFVSLVNFVLPPFRATDVSHFSNISAKEKAGLNELATILSMPQRIIP